MSTKGPAVLRGVKRGLPRSHSARLVGVSPETVKKWLQKAGTEKDPDGTYAKFRDEYEEARAHAVNHYLELVEEAAQAPHGRGGQYAIWMLEKLDPRTYGRKLEIQGTVEHVKTFTFAPPPMTPPPREIEVAPKVLDIGGPREPDPNE